MSDSRQQIMIDDKRFQPSCSAGDREQRQFSDMMSEAWLTRNERCYAVPQMYANAERGKQWSGGGGELSGVWRRGVANLFSSVIIGSASYSHNLPMWQQRQLGTIIAAKKNGEQTENSL